MSDGGVVEGKGRGAGHRTGHVGHAVVHHAVHQVGRVCVRGGMRGLEAAALVDRHVHDDGPLLHAGDHRTRDQFGRRRAGNQHPADHQFGVQHRVLQAVRVRIHGVDAVAEHQVELAQAVHVLVEHRDARADADGHLQRVRADHTGADDDDVPGRHPRHSAEQHAHAALGFFQMRGARLHRHAPRHLAHGCQQRQAAAGSGDGLVGDTHRARLEQRRGLRRVRRQMQVGVENLPGPQHGAFQRLRLLDLDDHVAACEHLGGIRRQRGAGRDIVFVQQPDRSAGAGLHQHAVAVRGQFAHARRRQPDPVFVVLDLLGYADVHGAPCSVRDAVSRSAVRREAEHRAFAHAGRRPALGDGLALGIEAHGIRAVGR